MTVADRARVTGPEPQGATEVVTIGGAQHRGREIVDEGVGASATARALPFGHENAERIRPMSFEPSGATVSSRISAS